MQVLHTSTRNGGLPVSQELCCSLLAAFVAVTSVTSLLGYSEPKPTLLGIAILVAAAVVMPWLAKEKRRLSGATGSAALRADAAQSALCAYLSLIALAGLAINAIWHVKWADPVAALVFCLSSFGRVEKPRGASPAAVADLTHNPLESQPLAVVKCWCTFEFPGTRLVPIDKVQGGNDGNCKNASTNRR